jgi:hypothetical protein
MKMNRHHHWVLMAAAIAFTATCAWASDAASTAVPAADTPTIEADHAGGGDGASTPPARHRVRPARRAGIDERMALLARELNLDASQQIAVRKILEMQRTDIVRIWSDESAPAAQRVYRTQALNTRTEDAIRTLLTDEQKKMYFKPRPAGVTAGGAPADLATWMDKMNGR